MGFDKSRWARLVLLMTLACVLAGCGGDRDRAVPNGQQGVADVLQEQAGSAEDSPSTSGGFSADTSSAFSAVDYDLTTMSSEMVYATVFDVMENPASYVGKVIRMSGPFYHTHYDSTDLDYFFVIVQDATACCSQGLEFVWGDGSHVWPDDYPEDGREVVVTGRFETYSEGEATYAHLVDASLEEA